MLCPNCGMMNPQENRFCSNCGKALDPKLPSEARTISFIKNPPATPQQKNLIIGAVVVIILLCGCLTISVLGWFYGDDAMRYVSTLGSGQGPTRTATRRLTPTATLTGLAVATITPTSQTTIKQWKASQVIDAFKAAGLEMNNPRPMNVEDYGTVPKVAREAIRFFQPSLGGSKGGRIYTFATPQDLETVRQYYESPQNKSATPPWIFVKDNILVQINGEYPENRAKKYEDVLTSMK